MHHAYCDQNFLISIRDAGEPYQTRLKALRESGEVRFVLSLWSLFEISRIPVPAKMIELAATVDHLGAGWLPERRNLHGQEIAAEFFRVLGIPYERPHPIRSLKEVAAETCQTVVPIGQEFSALQFVTLMRAGGAVVERMMRSNEEEWHALPKARSIEEVDRYLRPAVAAYIAELLPTETPSGIPLAPHVRAEFLTVMAFQTFRSIAVETAFLREASKVDLKRTPSNFLDAQYGIVALPYTDMFLTDDRKLRSLIERCRPECQFPLARVLSKAEFDGRFDL